MHLDEYLRSYSDTIVFHESDRRQWLGTLGKVYSRVLPPATATNNLGFWYSQSVVCDNCCASALRKTAVKRGTGDDDDDGNAENGDRVLATDFAVVQNAPAAVHHYAALRQWVANRLAEVHRCEDGRVVTHGPEAAR